MPSSLIWQLAVLGSSTDLRINTATCQISLDLADALATKKERMCQSQGTKGGCFAWHLGTFFTLACGIPSDFLPAFDPTIKISNCTKIITITLTINGRSSFLVVHLCDGGWSNCFYEGALRIKFCCALVIFCRPRVYLHQRFSDRSQITIWIFRCK